MSWRRTARSGGPARTTTPTSSGRCGVAAGTSALSPQFEFHCTPWAPSPRRPDRVSFSTTPNRCSSSTRLSRVGTANLNVWAVLRKAPPLPFLPTEVHGREVIVLAVFFSGDLREGRKLIAPAANFGTPGSASTRRRSPTRPGSRPSIRCSTPGARNYWKSHNFSALPDGSVRSAGGVCEPVASRIARSSSADWGGRARRPRRDGLRQPRREFRHERPWALGTRQEDAACIAWAREFFHASAKYATGGVYVNFMTGDGANLVRLRINYERLAQIKASTIRRTSFSEPEHRPFSSQSLRATPWAAGRE